MNIGKTRQRQMKSSRIIAALCAAVACAAVMPLSSFATTRVWNGADGAAWNGTEQNWLDGETPAAWEDGADAQFDAAASVTLAGNANAGDLTTASTLALSGPAQSTAFLNSSSPTLVFPGITLDEISPDKLAADITGNVMGSQLHAANAYHYRRSGTIATAQFQAVYNGHLRCVKVTFTESADGVKAQASSPTYYIHKDNGGASKLGVDIDADPNALAWGTIVAANDGSGGLGIRNLRGAWPIIRIAGSATLGGNVTLTNTTVELTAPIAQTLNRYLAGANDGISAKGLSDTTTDKTFGITDPSVAGASASWLTDTANGTVFTNMVLSRTTIESAVLRGLYISTDTVATPQFVTFDGEKMTCQLQAQGSSYVRGVVIELKQNGANVHARWVGGYFLQPGKLGDDITTGSAYARNQYGVKSLTLRTVDVPSLVFGGTSSPASLVADNAQIVLRNNLTYPRNSLVARNGAQVLLTSGGSANNNGSERTYTFESGSVLAVLVTAGTDGMAKFVFDNSTLYTPLLHAGWQDGNTTIRFLTLKNGARAVGNPLRCGDVAWMEYSSEGTGTNELASGVCLYFFNNAQSQNNTFCLTTTADMEVSGRIQDAPGYTGLPVYKRGAATLILSGANTFAGQFTVAEGTVELASDTALPASAPIALTNCVIACKAGTSNSTGVLTLSGNAALSLGEGSALAFADSSAAIWADGATLAVTGPDPLPARSLRFGTTDGGLTDSQLRQVKYNGRRVWLDPDGYATRQIAFVITVR